MPEDTFHEPMRQSPITHRLIVDQYKHYKADGDSINTRVWDTTVSILGEEKAKTLVELTPVDETTDHAETTYFRLQMVLGLMMKHRYDVQNPNTAIDPMNVLMQQAAQSMGSEAPRIYPGSILYEDAKANLQKIYPDEVTFISKIENSDISVMKLLYTKIAARLTHTVNLAAPNTTDELKNYDASIKEFDLHLGNGLRDTENGLYGWYERTKNDLKQQNPSNERAAKMVALEFSADPEKAFDAIASFTKYLIGKKQAGNYLDR